MPSSSSRNARLALALIALVPAAARAQKGNESDVSGVPVTTSNVVSSVFSPTLGGAIRVLTFITPQVARDYQQTTARLSAQLGSQVYTGAGGYRPPAATQNLLYELMSGGSASNAAGARLVQALTAGNASPDAVANAQQLALSLRGILSRGASVDPRYFNTLAATQLANASASFNAFIDASGEGLLSSPPPEVQAIHAVLATLTGR
ncbi:MAG TPA: hypothetical protein VG818_03445 [Gemmatimonadaceae bacterium]|nr:hypothetical protein [Gemmatimonadaceae bacterium]